MSGSETPRSIYDGDDDDETADPWFLRCAEEDDEAAAPATLADWAAAEQGHVRLIAETTRLLGRLEERLTREGGGDRLALIEASDHLWLEGVRIRPERLWMFRADRGAEPVTDRAAYQLGLWMIERLISPWPLSDEDDLDRFLGRRRIEDGSADLAALGRLHSSQDGAKARADWLAGQGAAASLHPLTQAACLADLWRRSGPGGRESDLEAAVIGARIAASGDGNGGGLLFAPLALGGRRRSGGPLGGEGRADRLLPHFLEAAQGGARRALLELGRLADWRARAEAAPLKKNPAALISLLATEYAVTTGRAEAHLGSVRQTALTSLNILRDHGLVREITGGKSFLYWTADLTADCRLGYR